MSPAQIEKQQFRNDSGGHLGAVVIGPKGEDRGIGIAPGETVWLSEAEQILTANAPRDPKDNPFIEQERIVTNHETGAKETIKITPLVPINENRFVPANERFVPGNLVGASDSRVAADAAKGEEPSVPVAEQRDSVTRHEEVEELGKEARPGDLPPTPSRARVAAEAAQPAEEAPEPSPGILGPPAPHQPPRAPEPAPEEHAEQVRPEIGEETGQAQAPSGEPVEGEYAQNEEVGQPDAPQQQPPPPFTPEQG